MLTAIIDATQNRDITTTDIPNAFIQTPMPVSGPGDEKLVMKITGVLAWLLVEMVLTTYGPYVTQEKGQGILYVQVLRALYGILVTALLW
jgi:hypothetical protein